MARDDQRAKGTPGTKRARMPRPQEVSDLLASVFSGKPVERLLREIIIWQVWDDVVGPQVARRARPSAIRDGILTVTVASGPWLQQLSFLKGEIIGRLNERAGEGLVRDIYLKAGNPRQQPRAAGTGEQPKRVLTAEEQSAIEQRSAVIRDGELRDLLADLMVRHSKATDRIR